MARRVLHLLLALTLSLNGISAPWAMAHNSHDAHEGHATQAEGARTSASTATGAHSHHAAHGSESMVAAEPGHSAPTAPMDASCCDGKACQCGCVLPPVVPTVTFVLLAPSNSTTPMVLAAQHAVVRRESPPLRPPAI